MIITDIIAEKEKLNMLISGGINEVFKNQIITEENMPGFRYDLEQFMKALQLSNKIYDYEVMLAANYITGKYEGKIAYSLANSNVDEYQDMVEFVL